MKTSIAIVRLTLRKNKTLADGTHPIMLKVSFHGSKEKATGFSCTPSQWDDKNERLKKTYPNAATVNQIIGKMKSQALERRDYLEAAGSPYTASDVLSFAEGKTEAPEGLKRVVEDYINERHLRLTTSRRYGSMVSALKRYYGMEVELSDITQERLRAFVVFERERGQKDSSIVQTLNSLNSTLGYAVSKGLIKTNPFTGFSYKKGMLRPDRNVYIHHTTLSILKKHMKTILDLDLDKGLPLQIRNRDYPLYFFMLSVLFQGLAPIDMFLLKKSDVEIKRIRGQFYYSIDTARRKTNVSVRIRIPKDDYSDAMLAPLLANTDTDFLLPYLAGKPSEAEVQKTLNRELHFINRTLRWHWQQINRTIGDRPGVIKIPEDATIYAARHSFAMAYMSQGGSPLALATLLGRSVNTIAVYVKGLNAEEDLADAVDVLDL